MKPSEILERSLSSMVEGSCWWHGPGTATGGSCASNAISKLDPAHGESWRMAHVHLQRAIGIEGDSLNPFPIFNWNDDPKRTFADIKGAFCRAIEAAKAEEAATNPSDEAVVDGLANLLTGKRSEDADREVRTALAYSLSNARALAGALDILTRPMPTRDRCIACTRTIDTESDGVKRCSLCQEWECAEDATGSHDRRGDYVCEGCMDACPKAGPFDRIHRKANKGA